MGKVASALNPWHIIKKLPDPDHVDVEMLKDFIGKLFDLFKAGKAMKNSYAEAKKAAIEKAAKQKEIDEAESIAETSAKSAGTVPVERKAAAEVQIEEPAEIAEEEQLIVQNEAPNQNFRRESRQQLVDREEVMQKFTSDPDVQRNVERFKNEQKAGLVPSASSHNAAPVHSSRPAGGSRAQPARGGANRPLPTVQEFAEDDSADYEYEDQQYFVPSPAPQARNPAPERRLPREAPLNEQRRVQRQPEPERRREAVFAY